MTKIILFAVACLYLSGCREDPDFYIRAAYSYSELGEFEKAIGCFDKALAQNPENYNIYIDKGITLREMMKKEEEALKIFTETIEHFPSRAYAYYCRAESYMRIEKYDKALEDYNSTINIIIKNRNNPFRLTGGAYNDYLQKDFSDPDADIDPHEVYANRGVAYFYLDSIIPAWIDLNFCISKSKQLAHCYFWRAFLNLRINKKSAACDDLKKAIALGYDGALVEYNRFCGCDTIKQ